jgi:hypothetical protein
MARVAQKARLEKVTAAVSISAAPELDKTVTRVEGRAVEYAAMVRQAAGIPENLG